MQKASAQTNLSLKNISDFIIPLPPLDVQREIVAKVEVGLKEADALAVHFKRLAALADETFKAELDETFSTLNAPFVKLGDMCEVIKRLKDIACDKFHYIDISSINRDKKTINEITEYERNLAPGRAQQVVEKGDVLVSTVRPNLNAVAMVEGDSVIQRIASTGFCVLRPNKNILSQFIYYFAQTRTFIAALVAVSEKASYPSVTDSVVKCTSIPLPPLDIQREIVGKLEAVKARCEQLKAEAERGLKATEALRKAVLAEAFEQ
jgi:type I restriction enzyme S subunit